MRRRDCLSWFLGLYLLVCLPKPTSGRKVKLHHVVHRENGTLTSKPANHQGIIRTYSELHSTHKHNVTSTKPTEKLIQKGKSRPDMSDKTKVRWLGSYYSLDVSNVALKIRHAPIPREGSPWPMPQVYKPFKMTYILDVRHFDIHIVGANCKIMQLSKERIKRNMFPGGKQSTSGGSSDVDWLHRERQIRSLNITVLKDCEDANPDMDMDESYDLEVKKTGAFIIAREVWGALRGMETFNQLIYQDSRKQFLVNKTTVHDYPRFSHRGILLDTSRHYLNKDTIITNLEIMAQNKMNVFHWHIVDEQSFPFESKVYPELTKKGAYDPETHTYTHEDIAEIIEEARLRGIRVIPEFDTPGHTHSWGYGKDDLLTPCYDFMQSPTDYFGPVNPILNSTYTFLKGLFKEVLQVFSDKYVHLGGDEVPFDCWTTNPFIQKFMKTKSFTIKDLLNYYETKLLDIITNIGRQRDQGSGYIVWQEVFDNGVKLKPDTVVQIWKSGAEKISEVTRAGLRALFSSCWYLDWTKYGQDWDKYYDCRELAQFDIEEASNGELLMGGEACLWTEYADDESILPRLWPRASAAAERLWSSSDLKSSQEAAPRIEEQRCRMIRLGLPVGVLSGPGFCRTTSKGGIKPGTDWRMSVLANNLAGSSPTNATSGDEMYTASYALNLNNMHLHTMNPVYLVPAAVGIFFCCFMIFSTVFNSRSKLLIFEMFSLGPAHWRFPVRGLLVMFSMFVMVWCVWSYPIWRHIWGNSNHIAKVRVTTETAEELFNNT